MVGQSAPLHPLLQAGELIQDLDTGEQFEVIRVSASGAHIRSTRIVRREILVQQKTKQKNGVKYKVMLEEPKIVVTETRTTQVHVISARSMVRHLGMKKNQEAVPVDKRERQA